jgi:hypothetical protein
LDLSDLGPETRNLFPKNFCMTHNMTKDQHNSTAGLQRFVTMQSTHQVMARPSPDVTTSIPDLTDTTDTVFHGTVAN